ncbi:GNAT family N-acetyltransferase [Rhodohalobacter sp. SW132]|uniref:GNAT family N-acetyltransferase n=1 Tax=Rhodohalobacter sp. SW132 TaxID=2293433 RepID=UPI000E27D9BC|nr:GNAT family N-acetyltransferase [Rhodohalobacter sp. SW132]REL39193.1 GNAT family N-acetyltransferase [Rhodohalobacter sp. SW132]
MKEQLIEQELSSSEIKKVNAKDRTRAIETIVLAFSSDPQLRFLYPDPLQYQTYAFDFFKAFGGNAFEQNSAHQAGGYSGVALWLPPDFHPNEEDLVNLIHKSADESKIQTVMAVLEQMERYQPDEPHWHLPLIGTDPAKQGQGYGTALLQYGLELIDQQGSIAYLENTNPKNKPLYERHGFKVLGVIQVDDSPPLFPMIRYPM